MDNVICRIIRLPSRVNAVTVLDENGDYNVYVNEALSTKEQQRAYRHECRHIRNSHFYIAKSAEHCEQEVKKKENRNTRGKK